jgi:hypothetical protein
MSTSGPCTEFPAPGLRNPQRILTGHDKEGKSVFIQVCFRQVCKHGIIELTSFQTDHGYHGAPMLGGAAAQTIMYSSDSNPIELTGDVDLEFLKKQVRILLRSHFKARYPSNQAPSCSHPYTIPTDALLA